MADKKNKSTTYIKLSEDNSKITIQDVADALGISKTTVSRAISGKGRIGEETRSRVMEYIEQYGYKPNPIAKGLAQQRTYNIGWVMPGDSSITDLPFFQKCMSGVSEEAASADYDVLLSMVYDHNTSGLERMVKGSKVDGVILGRTLVDDENVTYLKQSGIPFVVVGSTTQSGVVQIDNDHVNACRELIMAITSKGAERFVLIGGSDEHVVNLSRRKGFELGISESGYSLDDQIIYMNSDNDNAVREAVANAVSNSVDCIVCMDDKICNMVMEYLNNSNIAIPDTIKVASFYNSEMVTKWSPKITAIQFNPKSLGATACKMLLSYINGEQVPEKTLMNYDIFINKSTG